MKEIMNLGFKLLLISLVAALSLGYVNDITKDKIEYQRELANEKARIAVMSEADKFEEVNLADKGIEDKMVVEGFIALKGGEAIGYVFKTKPKGYGGALEVIVGISNKNQITGVRIGNHNETPGLGAKSQDEEFYGQYYEMNTENPVGVSKTQASKTEIKAISGATITSKAVTRGVNHAIDAFKKLTE